MIGVVITFLFVSIIILVNIPNLLPIDIVQQLALTITLGLMIVVWSYIQYRHYKKMTIVKQPIIKQEPETILDLQEKEDLLSRWAASNEDLRGWIDLQLIDLSDGIIKDRLLEEQKKYSQGIQSYMWLTHIMEQYHEQWMDIFQNPQMPVEESRIPKMRSLLMEIALHTIDFCRYRTEYVNLTSGMQVNPTLLLLNQSMEKAGAVPYVEDPLKVSREIRSLFYLTQHDNIKLKNVTIQGYKQ